MKRMYIPPAMHRQFCTNTKTFFHLVLSLFTCYCYKSLRQFTASILWEKNVFLMCLHIYQKRIQRGQGSLSTIDMINSQGISVALHQVQAFALLKKKIIKRQTNKQKNTKFDPGMVKRIQGNGESLIFSLLVGIMTEKKQKWIRIIYTQKIADIYLPCLPPPTSPVCSIVFHSSSVPINI